MNIRIIKCYNTKSWYVALIGTVHTVIREDIIADRPVYVVYDSVIIKYVLKDDAEIV